jgi:hypothetical protein
MRTMCDTQYGLLALARTSEAGDEKGSSMHRAFRA